MVLASIGDQVTRAFTVFFAWLPHLVGALVVLIIGYIVAKILAGVVARVAHRAGFDRLLHAGQGGSVIQRVVSSPSALLGKLTFWALFLGAISLAVSVLGVDALKDFVASIFAYLPNVLVALLIFIVASAISVAIAGLATKLMGDTAVGKIVASVAPALVMAIAVFMILVQLRIAVQIVTITYAALIGSIALGAALAFGLGGREVAAQMLQGAYDKGRDNKEQVKQEVSQGVDRAKQEAERKKDELGRS